MRGVVVWAAIAAPAAGQGSPASAAAPQTSPVALQQDVDQLRAALDSLRADLAAARRESSELRQSLDDLRRQLDAVTPPPAAAPTATAVAGSTTLDEEIRLLAAKVDDQYQTKVESGSKQRVRLSGMALVNAFANWGAVDSIDTPLVAQAPSGGDTGGNVGATARQSLLSVEVFGPEWRGAKSRGSVDLDFAGGFPATPEGVTAGFIRLRTAHMALEWPGLQIQAGQDVPFFTPLSPTSLASTAYPALSSSGNLWAWTPQLVVEHRRQVSDRDRVLVQWGLLDPLTGEIPEEYHRVPTAGERGRTPALATRVAWQRTTDDRAPSVGIGAYYARQAWGDDIVHAWAATADWHVPIGPRVSLTGEAYNGRAIGGLGGGVNGSVAFGPSPAGTIGAVQPVESAGGWSQLSITATPFLEFNAAAGVDRPQAIAWPGQAAGVEAPGLTRNASGFINAIFQPRSSLLFSVEYRRLWTSGLSLAGHSAGHLSVSSAIVF